MYGTRPYHWGCPEATLSFASGGTPADSSGAGGNGSTALTALTIAEPIITILSSLIVVIFAVLQWNLMRIIQAKEKTSRSAVLEEEAGPARTAEVELRRRQRRPSSREFVPAGIYGGPSSALLMRTDSVQQTTDTTLTTFANAL